jgi:hypothetical protein
MNTHTRQLWFLIPALAALVAVAGCDNDLPLTSQLERTRVVGARVVTASDPGRADVNPGEAATIEWIVLGPAAPATLDWAFAQCRAKNGACIDDLTPAGAGSGAPVVVPFTTPPADALTDGRVPVMMGSVCADGTLGIDPATDLPSCTGGPDASGTNAQYVIPFVAAGATANRHPNLSNDRVDVGGVEWTTAATGDAGGPCDGSDGAPVVTAPSDDDDAKVELRFTTDGDDRESYIRAMETAPSPEELQLSFFATAGKFDTSYGAIYRDDTRENADVTVKWAPPSADELPAGGLTVQFHFVMRDGRGGLDLTHRSLCVVAP